MIRPSSRPSLVDERQLLDLALDHDALGLGRLERAAMHHEPVERRHPLGDARAAIGHEPHVALGQQAPAAAAASSTTTSVPTRERAIRPGASPIEADSPTL